MVSTQQRDWVTLTLQSYLTRVDNGPQGPHPIFDDADDRALVWRIFNANQDPKGWRPQSVSWPS